MRRLKLDLPQDIYVFVGRIHLLLLGQQFMFTGGDYGAAFLFIFIIVFAARDQWFINAAENWKINEKSNSNICFNR